MHDDRLIRGCSGAALAIAIFACGGGNAPAPNEPVPNAPAAPGVLRVVTETGGSHIDADGFEVSLDNGTRRVVGVNDSVTFQDVPSGPRTVSLGGVSRNCDRMDGGPLQAVASVAPGGMARVVFRMQCGPLVLLDEGHYNYHTLAGRYAPFGVFLRGDGFVVKASTAGFAPAMLAGVDVLVISNALHPQNATVWSLPTPSAFSPDETDHVKTWVEGGGSLLLIADHMPFPGAAAELAAAFGMMFRNGFAFDTLQLFSPKTCLAEPEVHVFRRSDGSLRSSVITDGRTASERIDSVATFTGQAFDPSSAGEPLLLFGASAIQLFPTTAWEFSVATERASANGWSQGSFLQARRGRVAFFGEAAMFSVQTCSGGPGIGQVPMGMNSPRAQQNGQLLLNVLRWLTRELG